MSLRKKDTLISLVGIVTGQLILFACFSVIGRHWGVEELGRLNSSLSLGMFLGTVLALRYELACVQDNQRKSYEALIHTVLIAALSLVFLSLIVNIWNIASADLILVFSATFLLQQASGLYLNTLRKYKLIAAIKVASSLGLVISLSALAATNNLSNTFEVFTYINLIFSSAVFFIIVKLNGRVKVGLLYFKENSKFPRYTLPATFLNAAILYSLPIIIPFLFGAATAGFFAVTQRIGFFPVSLSAQSISGIYRRELVSSITSNREGVLDIFFSHFRFLVVVAVLYLVVGNILFGMVVEMLFGQGWGESASYFHALSPLYAMQVIYIPLSQVFMVSNNQRKDLVIQSVLFVVSGSSLFSAYVWGLDVVGALILFSASSVVALMIGVWLTYSTTYSICDLSVHKEEEL
ncbi:hypothetical protein LPB260_14180 [Pseudomonas sp. LPB0260]|uniref:hypothetical protein n=1 Tax=Pseudomonas sp. LPB0260 TaxID=2614442 RepID=UPI0015C27226|nr:hypothetical protein [Pseudomonas sp. LPB0260]QLC74726.1 hypothetical protein LPB260_14180 [Pseudomonas sp. LPB0260]